MNLDRLDEALGYVAGLYDDSGQPMGHDVRLIHDAARAYRELLTYGMQGEPDYGAAMDLLNAELRFLDLNVEFGTGQIEPIVDAAIGDRLLIDRREAAGVEVSQ